MNGHGAEQDSVNGLYVFTHRFLLSINDYIYKSVSFYLKGIHLESYLQWSLIDIYSHVRDRYGRFVEYMSHTITRRIIYLFYIKLPLIILYYLNVFLLRICFNAVFAYVLSMLALLCHRSLHIRKVVIAAKTLLTAIINSFDKFAHMKISQLIILIMKFVLDVSDQNAIE